MLVHQLADDPLRFVLLSSGEQRLLERAVHLSEDAPLRAALERRIKRRIVAVWLSRGQLSVGGRWLV